MQAAIIVHGGAGAWNREGEPVAQAVDACERAAAAGQTILVNGGTALDAVETAIRILEDDPVLDAGRGSFLNARGEVEMDALIMDGRDLNMGAVAAVQRVQNPISLARRVMEDSEHTMLVASGAEAFADGISFPRCAVSDLLVGAELERYEALSHRQNYRTDEIFKEPGAMGDTVGAVALDLQGNLAAGTSTGGTRQKLPGRVGDSPLVGSGAYADNLSAGVSATGYGEALMKVLISARVCDFVSAGMSAFAACDAAMRLLEERTTGNGGLIAVDARGHIGYSFNTAAMPYAFAAGRDAVQSGH